MGRKIKSFFINLLKELKDWRTFLLFGIVVIVIGSSVWLPLLIGLISNSKWWLGIAATIEAIWLGPVPFIPICVIITLTIKKIFTWRKNKNEN